MGLLTGLPSKQWILKNLLLEMTLWNFPDKIFVYILLNCNGVIPLGSGPAQPGGSFLVK